jgi:hypothetical protein
MLASARPRRPHSVVFHRWLLLLGGAAAGGRKRCASEPRGFVPSVVLLFRVGWGVYVEETWQ